MCVSVKKKSKNNTIIDKSKKLIINLLKCIIIQIHCIFDYMVDFFLELRYGNRGKRVPPIKNSLLLDSAVKLAEKIRTKQVTAEEVVKTFIERCKEVNGLINAIVEERYEAAIKEAKEVDKLIETSKDPSTLKETRPFLGVPFTTKESNEAEGCLHTMGLICRREQRSKADATVIGYMKKAGGILIAKTNIPELNLWSETRNNLYGQTNNPYNTTRTVGGSSGGDAAIVAACGVPFAVGSDIGGSIRMPAFFNGVFGHKPTERMTPLKGVGLRNEDYPDSMAEAGPICKRVEDLIPLLKILVGDNVSKLKLDEPVKLANLKVFYQLESGDLRSSKVNRVMRATLRRAVEHFEGITKSTTKIKIPGSEYSYRLWRYWMSQEGFDFSSALTNGKYRANGITEIKKLISGTSEITLGAIFKLTDDNFLPKDSPEWARNLTDNMKKYLLETLGNNGVLFYPSFPTSAGYHNSAFFRPFNFGYWCIFNVVRFPVCQVPLGLDYEGLPIGIQVVAAPYNDHLCIAAAKELQRAFGGWVPPSV